MYDDADHPDRPTSAIQSPDWTEDDRALMVALADHEDTLCPGCGNPKAVAWHSEMDGWFEATKVVCHACTASRDHQAVYAIVADTRENPPPLPTFELGVTTSEPSKT